MIGSLFNRLYILMNRNTSSVAGIERFTSSSHLLTVQGHNLDVGMVRHADTITDACSILRFAISTKNYHGSFRYGGGIENHWSGTAFRVVLSPTSASGLSLLY